LIVPDTELIYRDDTLLVVNKPAGLLAVPGRGADKQDCLSVRLQKEFPDALVVHRLDMATSGLIVFARGAEMQRHLSRMFREREIDKRYVALVKGRVEPLTGEVDLPIAADWPNRPLRKIDVETGKPSLTRYRVLSYDNEAAATSPHDTQDKFILVTSRVELEPVTGRTHQLRVHMSAIGHPIVGDALYGVQVAERMMLHACSLRFIHPVNGTLLDLQSAPPF
jgi:tRNA pseudouridine32 synthase / 23S rRNA pseudouridine746 synthase